ncbi:protein kinase domain-containing protein, partial [Salmonella sp. s54395]|uniref:protein kinase domain-containing protein n=1 Tax=Salmonella sp. s54395 TaxID=3159664 RepID=UPI00397EE65A
RKPITPASDVWSIGVIAYILLSGCSPFMGDDDRQTLMNVRDGVWEFEEDIWDEISKEAKDFITKVLVVDVEERYNLKQCLEHPWLKFDERRDRGEAKISTERLKNFNSRRKWRKALNAVKSMMRLKRLSSLIRKEEEEKKQEEEQEGETPPQGGDSEMASPSTSEPRTPTTP